MAKGTGLAWTAITVDDGGGVARAIVNDVTNFNFSTPRAVQDTTGADKSAMERLLLLADFSVTLNGIANLGAVGSTATAHGVFGSVPSSDQVRTTTLTHSGVTLACETLFTDYGITRAQGGELTWTAPGVLANGAVPTWA